MKTVLSRLKLVMAQHAGGQSNLSAIGARQATMAGDG
jgi:hypothetical protein